MLSSQSTLSNTIATILINPYPIPWHALWAPQTPTEAMKQKKNSILPERATGGINEELDIFSGVLSIQEEQLAHDSISHKVIDVGPKEHDPLPQQQPHHITFRSSHGLVWRLGRRQLKSDSGFFRLVPKV